MKAIVLCAGRGERFRPVTEAIPKPLFPFLNVPLVSAQLRRLREAGVGEVAINLHHLGDQIERHLRDQPVDSPQLSFFEESRILGTAGALRNAASFLADGDFLVVNADAAVAPDFARLIARHRETGRAATLLVVENRDPDRYTPLQAEGDRIAAFGIHAPASLLYTGVCVLAPRLLSGIPTGETSLVADLWQPLLRKGREEIGWLRHEGPFADLGLPRDFLRASLEALERRGPFPDGGTYDDGPRVLSREAPRGFDASLSVLGRVSVGEGVAIQRSTLWDGVSVGARARLADCVVARGAVPAGCHYEKALLWSADGGTVSAYPLEGPVGNAHGVQPLSPRL
jgi:NDP-sugar pyrophosphorylase family protein